MAAGATVGQRSVGVPLDGIERIEDTVSRLLLDGVGLVMWLGVQLRVEAEDCDRHLHGDVCSFGFGFNWVNTSRSVLILWSDDGDHDKRRHLRGCLDTSDEGCQEVATLADRCSYADGMPKVRSERARRSRRDGVKMDLSSFRHTTLGGLLVLNHPAHPLLRGDGMGTAQLGSKTPDPPSTSTSMLDSALPS